jgi:hypothetical protein
MGLKPADVAKAIASGINQKIPDGKNLYLIVRNGRGYWVYQYREGKVIKSKGLGSTKSVTPAQARQAREAFAVARRNGTVPPPPPVTGASLSAAVVPAGKTFGEIVPAFIAARAEIEDWKGGPEGREANAYRRTLLGSALEGLPVAAIDTAAVLAAIKPLPAITSEKTRVRIATILDWAKAFGYRQGENELLLRLRCNVNRSGPSPPREARARLVENILLRGALVTG